MAVADMSRPCCLKCGPFWMIGRQKVRHPAHASGSGDQLPIWKMCPCLLTCKHLWMNTQEEGEQFMYFISVFLFDTIYSSRKP